MELFNKTKNSLIRKLGREPLSDTIINKVGKEIFGVKWGGVGSQSMPIPKTKDRYYIINTAHNDRSRGVHWVALYVSKSGKQYVYDSFARNTNHLMFVLQKKLKGGAVGVNKESDQNSGSNICGHASLAWLNVVDNLGIREASKI
jgi:hypothetical protein